MKSERTGLFLLAGAMLALAPGRIDAQSYSPLEKVSISGTGYEQGATHDNGTSSNTANPTKFSITTASLLAQLVADEYSYGNKNFTSARVPAGAVLKFYGTGFEIDQGTSQLADVSADGFLSWSATSGQNDINAGTFLDSGGQTTPPYNQVNYSLATLTYTSPPPSSNPLFLTVTGLATITTKATTPNHTTGKYTLSASVNFSDGTGEGDNVKGAFVVTGFTMTGSGSMTATNN
jgi:hypothetical protein